jgi:hypothetical protein
MISLFWVGIVLMIWAGVHFMYRRARYRRTMERDTELARELVNTTIKEHNRGLRGLVPTGPIVFIAICCMALVLLAKSLPVQNIVSFNAPEYIGIVKVERPNRYTLYDFQTKRYFDIDTCNKSNEQWYAGHVMSWVAFLNTGKCQLMGPKGLGDTKVRDNDRTGWHELYGDVTRDDCPGYKDCPGRPVLALNCHNNADDSDTVCVGGEAKFTKGD